ncbi:MAG: hypothetical protein H0T84_00440 [Tatlockia sp.]|nr:hypothetical protein [Tatlockia sp.]
MRIKIGKHRKSLAKTAKGSQGKGSIQVKIGSHREPSSYLVDETFLMEKERREKEQQGHRQLAKVNVVEHQEPRAPAGPEGEIQNDIKQHPWLESQRNDGIDPNENPEPALNTAARTEYDNAKREQELEYKLRHNLMAQPDTAPKPNQ